MNAFESGLVAVADRPECELSIKCVKDNMKKSINHLDSEGAEEWLNEILRSLKTYGTGQIPSADFNRRCVAAVTGALDVARMREHRQRLANTPGSLAEHFQALARLAEVKSDSVFKILGIARADEPDITSARGMAQLSRHLGLSQTEAILRLRCGYAQLNGVRLPTEWQGAPLPARGRQGIVSTFNIDAASKTLRRVEADYEPKRRAELNAAVNVFAEVYERETP
jgi:hypothetical protein